MLSDQPFFSICIPAHNPLPFIELAFSSIAAQTFSSWEVILVDDHSDDIFDEWIHNQTILPPEKLTVCRLEENCGPFYARRVAFGAATGAYILCLDADDDFMNETVLQQLNYSIVSNDVVADVVLFNVSLDKKVSNNWIDYSAEGINSGWVSKDLIIKTFLSSQKLNNLCSKAIRRELLLPADLSEAKGYYMCEDRLETAGVICAAENYFLLNKPLYHYRTNPSSTTHRKFDLDYCWQQSHTDKVVASLFSDADGLDLLYTEFLQVWADDMCLLTRGRSYSQLLSCYRQMAADDLFLMAFNATDANYLRTDRKILLQLLRSGRYTACAILSRSLFAIKERVRGFVR